MRAFASSLVLTLALGGCFAPKPADHLYRCATSRQCPSGYDCAADGYCWRHGHVPMSSDPCADQAQDGDETGVDCGGPTCPTRCPVDQGCAIAADCASGVCNLTTGRCVADDCADGARDDAESDIDCGGGTCPGCGTGQSCTTPGDCKNFLCNQTSHQCVSDPCFDGVKDQSETDVDCGGLCTQHCKNGQACNGAGDCVTGAACAGGKCQIAHCVNGTLDSGETDVDCGGAECGACAVGKRCSVGSDCASTFCNAQTHVCVDSQCKDGVKDGTESDVDCGGSDAACQRCADGKVCSGGGDCLSDSICTTSNTCCHPSGTACNGVQCGNATDNCGQKIPCGNGGLCADQTKPYCKSGCCTSINDQTQACAGKQCGSVSDGCGTTYPCGTCPSGYTCSNAPSYQCCAGVDAACAGKPGCTQVSTACGTITCPCATGQVCYAGACCTPSCDSSRCDGSDDGCGGACPVHICATKAMCCPDGYCGISCPL